MSMQWFTWPSKKAIDPRKTLLLPRKKAEEMQKGFANTKTRPLSGKVYIIK